MKTSYAFLRSTCRKSGVNRAANTLRSQFLTMHAALGIKSVLLICKLPSMTE